MRNAHLEWNSIAAEYDKKIVRGDFFRNEILDRALIKHIGETKNKTLLDLGCGQGYLSEMVSSTGTKIIGIDISETLIEIANKRYKKDGISFVVGDIEEELPFKENVFDITISNMVFMDIGDPKKSIKEVVRVTKNGGTFILSILHPLFTSGVVHKPIKDFFLYKSPSFLIKNYKKEKRMTWNILNTTKKTTVFHRPIEFYIELLLNQNISLLSFEELTLPEIHKENGFQTLLHSIPMFLVIKGIINK